jgi:SAM-dependent methyltransferase
VSADSRQSAQAFWDREIVAPSHVSWMENLWVREAINARIGGAEQPAWPIDWFERWLGGRRFRRALSIGCGGGALERDLVRRGLCARVDAFDGSPVSLLAARKAADAEGLGGRIGYYAADFNEPALPRKTYDIVFFHQSAHHVAKLEKIYRAILRALVPGGLLYLDEYVGPSRSDWTEALLAPHGEVYARFPPEARRSERLALPIQEDDPSEAIRSSEIVPQLHVGFDIAAERPYGGTLLSVLYPSLQPSALTEETVRALIAEEQRMLDAGALSYYTVLVARPKRGPRKWLASAEYWFVPKAKRVMREIKARL